MRLIKIAAQVLDKVAKVFGIIEKKQEVQFSLK